ncbi:MAG: YdcF family protein [Leptolyngbyaceae cyanobacterium]
MLKPPACSTNDATEEWVEFTGRLFKLFSNPAVLIALIVIVGVVSILLLRHKQHRAWITRLSLGLMLSIIGLSLVGNYLLIAFVPPDNSEAAQAVVVLGRGQDLRKARSAHGLSLVESGRAPLVFFSGKSDANRTVKALEAQGVASAILDGEACSRTTAENAKFTAQVLMERDIKKIILVTDAPHMLRAYLTFQKVGFQVIPQTTPFPSDYGRYRRQVLAVREVISFISYGLQGHYSKPALNRGNPGVRQPSV